MPIRQETLEKLTPGDVLFIRLKTRVGNTKMHEEYSVPVKILENDITKGLLKVRIETHLRGEFVSYKRASRWYRSPHKKASKE